jgi:hypothetical protein
MAYYERTNRGTDATPIADRFERVTSVSCRPNVKAAADQGRRPRPRSSGGGGSRTPMRLVIGDVAPWPVVHVAAGQSRSSRGSVMSRVMGLLAVGDHTCDHGGSLAADTSRDGTAAHPRRRDDRVMPEAALPTPDAVHEAAHAVVAVMLGCRYARVSMPDANGYGGGVETVVPFSREGNLRGGAISMAGPLAERRIRRVDDWDDRYRAHRRELEGRRVPDGRAADEAGEEFAERLLQDPQVWESVLEVARLLDASSPIAFESVESVVRSQEIEIMPLTDADERNHTLSEPRSVFHDRSERRTSPVRNNERRTQGVRPAVPRARSVVCAETRTRGTPRRTRTVRRPEASGSGVVGRSTRRLNSPTPRSSSGAKSTERTP